jgi:hypothetical protein
MDFDWSPEQLELRDSVETFASHQLQDDLVRRDHEHTFSRELWDRCAAFGIQGLPFPPEYGGSGYDPLTTVLALEALGYGCKDAGLVFGIGAQMWSVQMPIARHGTDEQRGRYLGRLCGGEWIGAHGMSEPDSGSDAFSLRTRAIRDGDDYILTGTKTFVSEAPVADLFLVFATIDPALGPRGITAFLVERAMDGVDVSGPIGKMGLRTSPMAELVLDGCRVPGGNRLGREGRGGLIFNDSMEWERSCLLAGAVGTLRRQLESAVRYAGQREQFGRRIGEFQAVSHRLADMRVRLETSRLLLYRAAWLKQCGHREAGPMSALAKLHISEACVSSALDAVRIRGGYGYTTEYEVERELRDSVGGTLYSGTSDIQRALLARAMGF